MVARGRGKKAAAASEAAVALANGDGVTQGIDEVATNAAAPAAAPGKKGRPRGAKKEAKEEPEESPPVEIADKPTKAGKSTKGSKKVSKSKAAVAEPEEVPAPAVDVKDEEELEEEETAEEKIKTAAATEKKTHQRKRKADSVDKVEEPASVAKKAAKTKTKAAKKETVDSAGVPENPAAKLTPVLPEAQTNGNKKSASNRKRAAPKIEETPLPSADDEEQIEEEEIAAIPPAAKKPSRGRAPKKDAKKPATKTKGSKKVIKAPEDEAPEDDVLPEDEFNPEEDKEDEQDPLPEPEPEVKAKKPIKSKGSRKQLKDDIPPVEEEVADIKDDIPESQDSEEEVKKPRGRKPAAKKASGAKSTSKKTTKAKKAAKAESAEESVNDDQDAADTDITERKANGSAKPKVEPAEKKKARGGKRAATTPTEVDETDGSKNAKLDGPANATVTDFKPEDFALDKEFKLKISSWNIAGLRSWLKKDKLLYLQNEQPDVLCLQEIKCTTDQLPEEARIPGYHPYWLCMPGGHAGVAVYSKIMPINVEYGIGDAEQDDTGRMITAEYEKFYLICVYVPNSGRKLVNLEKRLKWEQLFREYVQRLDKIKPVIIAGDMNVSHKEIDLANPKTNTKNAGFTPGERDAMTKLLELGYVDTFRHLYPDKKGAYTFWSYLGKARSKNIGWRLDYFIVSERITSKVVENTMRAQVLGSDHCPITLFLNI